VHITRRSRQSALPTIEAQRETVGHSKTRGIVLFGVHWHLRYLLCGAVVARQRGDARKATSFPSAHHGVPARVDSNRSREGDFGADAHATSEALLAGSNVTGFAEADEIENGDLAVGVKVAQLGGKRAGLHVEDGKRADQEAKTATPQFSSPNARARTRSS